MPTVKLTPSTYATTGTGTQYLSVSNISNAYTDTSSSTYATLTNADSGTVNTHSLHLRGFDFSSIPSDVTVTSFSVKVKGSHDSNATDKAPYLANGTSTLSGTTASTKFTTSVTTITVPKTGYSWATISGYGNSFGIVIPVGKANKNKNARAYVYGAEVSVTYTLPSPKITVGTPSRTIISDESGYDQCVCTFRSDLALQAWEARATKSGTTPARGVGLLVESGTTLAANTDATVVVDDEELTNGDGEYTITVYGQSTGGVWSE